MAEIKYKVGDLVKIKKNLCCHHFKIGQTVRVKELETRREGHINTCENLLGNDWWNIDNSEVEPFKEDVNNKQSSIKTETMNITKSQMKSAVETVAIQLATNTGKITTLDLKNELRKVYPAIVWNQYKTGVVEGVSDLFHELVREGKFYSIADNGTYQTYLPKNVSSANALGTAIKKANPAKTGTVKASPTVSVSTTTPVAKKAAKKAKKPTYTVTQLRDMMKNNKGHFFTSTFISQKGERTINGQYVSNQVIKPGQEHYVLVREAIKMKKTPTDDIRQINLNTLKILKIAGKTIVI